jgi:hypothetical protein
MIARISVAYAELAPEVKMTLGMSRALRRMLKDIPDQDGLFDAEFTGIELETEQPGTSAYNALVCQQMS